jgi:hypothetical protein
MAKFNYCNVPDQWGHAWTKYPQGETILEALLDWIAQVDSMVDNVNDWNTYLDEFKLSFDGELRTTVESVLEEMDADGSLNAFINEAVLNEQVKGNDNTRYKLVGGAIRNDGTGWTIIDDASHKNINLLSVEINPDDPMTLLLKYTYDGTSIGTLVITPDETLAKGGLLCGGSVGDNQAILTITAPLIMQVTGKTLVSPDKWHNSVVSIASASDNTGLTITHPAQVTSQPPVATIAEGGTNNGMGGEIRVNHTLTTTTLTYYQYLHGYVTYNGTSWTISTDNVDKATVSWDATNNALKIEHPTIDEEYAVSISGGNGFRPTIISQGVGSMLIQFVNTSGTIMTTQDPLMKVNFMRFTKVKSTYPSGLKVNVHRGYIQCDPEDIIEQFGNFWIYGVHGA